MRRLLVPVLLAVVVAGPAHAGTRTIGSDLKAKATVSRSAPVDSAYWNTKLGGGGRVTAPAKGEVGIVRLKGRVVPASFTAPNVVMHVQVLRPIGGGRVKVMVTSGDLAIPFGGDPQRISTYDLQTMPARICVKKGDYVALSTSGGFGPGYEDGAPFRVFGTVGGSAIKAVTGAGRDMDGDVFKGKSRSGKELLMQVKVRTGKSARPTCQ